MPDKDGMTNDELWKHLWTMGKRGMEASRRERSKLLDQAERTTAVRQKSLILPVSKHLTRKKPQRERGHTYSQRLVAPCEPRPES